MGLMTLPAGQRPIADFPRFGLPQYADRFPQTVDAVSIEIADEQGNTATVSDALKKLEKIDQVSDFHCVTTWSHLQIKWSGYRFRDVLEKVIEPALGSPVKTKYAIFSGQDGYKNVLPIKDLLADDMLLATELHDQPLSVEHGAPMRLIAPAHYGYKSVKHLKRIDFANDLDKLKRPRFLKFLFHPRGRVDLEERGEYVPGWALRYLYRPLIAGTRKRFETALSRRRD